MRCRDSLWTCEDGREHGSGPRIVCGKFLTHQYCTTLANAWEILQHLLNYDVLCMFRFVNPLVVFLDVFLVVQLAPPHVFPLIFRSIVS